MPLRRYRCLSASAPRTALPAIWNIPSSRNPFFLGRENELTQIRYRLQAGQAMALSQPQAIGGLGGIGKTQLALEYAYRYHQDYIAVLWAHAENFGIDLLLCRYRLAFAIARTRCEGTEHRRASCQALVADPSRLAANPGQC